jgi:hypothetical protein|tara:strand:+ start:104 stop:580 length:477 start_codon:yes stop_codon:yes gene_type:complete
MEVELPMADYIENFDIPCVCEIQTMGFCTVPKYVRLDRIIIEPRQSPHLGEFRLVITIDGSLVFSDVTPISRYTIDIDDMQTQSQERKIIVVVIPADIQPPLRHYLQNETVSITVLGDHTEESRKAMEEDTGDVVVDKECLESPESCEFSVDFSEQWE